jgi:hypothetical protein
MHVATHINERKMRHYNKWNMIGRIKYAVFFFCSINYIICCYDIFVVLRKEGKSETWYGNPKSGSRQQKKQENKKMSS